MGLYITAWFEGKDKKEKWFLANPRFVNLDNPEKVNPPQALDLRMDKNYLLYAVLGDVRNDYSIPYIQRLRGIPGDATPVVKEEAEIAYDSIGKGYVTAKELKSYYESYKNDKDEVVRAAAGFVWELYLNLLHICYGVRNDEENYLDDELYKIALEEIIRCYPKYKYAYIFCLETKKDWEIMQKTKKSILFPGIKTGKIFGIAATLKTKEDYKKLPY